MNCEVCGKPISGNPIRVKIDGSVMEVCKDCSKFGKIQKAPPRPKYVQNKKSSKNSRQNQKRNYNRNDEPTEELIEDFGMKVRKAREAKNLSRKELGEKIYEKVSVISKVETEKMIPDLKLAKKFEKALNITIIEKVDSLDLESFKNISSSKNTLGSIVKFKK